MVGCMTMSPAETRTLNETSSNKTIVTGGHFMISNKDRLNSGTIESFKKAVATYKELKSEGENATLGLFINDIGLTCSGGDSCSIEEVKLMRGLTLPDEYISILAENGIPESDVVIISERFLRNRAKRIFHHIRKSTNAFVEHPEGYYYAPQDRPEIILTRKNSHDKYGTPACPLIMGAFGLELKRMGYNSSINYYYVGSDNVSNIPNYIPIEKGKLLSLEVDPEISIDNVYIA